MNLPLTIRCINDHVSFLLGNEANAADFIPSDGTFKTTLIRRESTLPPCGELRYACFLPKDYLTSHEEEQSSHILHEIMILTAAQHAYDPAEKDDGYGHANETSSHPLEVWGGGNGTVLALRLRIFSFPIIYTTN